MSAEEITFRMPNFEDDGEDAGAERRVVSGEVGNDDIVPQEAGDDNDDQRTHSRSEPTVGEDTQFKSYAPEDARYKVDESARHPSGWDARDENEESNDSGERLSSRGKDEALAPTRSIALAPTQSMQVGEVREVGEVGAHRVVKKRTYLHRSHKMYSERIQRHTFLMKTLAVGQNIWTMVSTFPYWDMAFWSGFMYAVGSAMFIIDGAFSFGPLASPSRHWAEGEDKYAGPVLFFLGAVICYQTGAVMAYFEAINDGCFAGVAMKRFWVDGSDEDKKKLLDAKLHRFFGHIIPHHHHHDDDEENNYDGIGEKTREELDPDAAGPDSLWRTVASGEVITTEIHESELDPVQPMPSRRQAVDHGPGDEEAFHEYMTWRWWPTWHALRTYHLRELGYVACSIQLLGATLYGVTGIVVLPGILHNLAWWQKIAAFWVPQVVASVCFLVAAIMFTLESQDVWYKPLFGTVRWWIGGWAAIGSVGFLLCACFGLGSNKYTWCEYQSDLSSTWGSAAYLFSSLLQWYEAVSAGPVLAFPNNRTPVLMRKSRNKV